jgi:Anti-sigma-K factor rskA
MSDTEPQSLPEFSPELLAGYVLGDLTPAEITIVEAYLAAHPEQQAEVASLMLPLDLLSLTLPADNPPGSLRTKILKQAAAGQSVVHQSTESLQGDSLFSNNPHPKSLSLRERDFNSGSLLPEGEGLGMRAVNLRKSAQTWKSILVGLGLLAIAGLGWNSYRLSHELATVKQDLKVTKIAQQQKSSEYQSVVSLLPQPNNRYFSLKNMQGKGGVGSLVIVPNKSIALLALQKVESLPPGQVYRVWAIIGDEEVDCAHFIPDGSGKVLMQIPVKAWEKASKITITIEQQEAKEPEGEIAIEGEI